MKTLRVLIVEDSENDAALAVRELRRTGYEVTYQQVESADQMRAALKQSEWDLVISDFTLPHFNGLEALQLLHELRFDLPFIFVSATLGEDAAVEAMKLGAHDYVMKGNLKRLVPAIERELKDAKVREEQRRVEEQRRHLEEQLRQAQKMEAVGRLAGGVAHDFNNLLTVIMGCAEILRGAARGSDRSECDEILRACDRAASLTRQLLAFSRGQVLEPRILSLNACVEDTSKMLRRLIGEDIRLVVNLTPERGLVKIDIGQLEQVILNLAVNARDAMPRGGVLTLQTCNADLARNYQSVAPGSYVKLVISDSGTGMDQETRSHIFEPFFTTKEHGTGLGLATVYGIVKQSGGEIVVRTELGQGTIFEIFFPQVVGAENGDLKETFEIPGGTETILLVEDEPKVLELMKQTLELRGYTVLAASGGKQALHLFSTCADDIRLLICDVVMPEMSGRELADHLKQMKGELEILHISGYTDDVLVRHRVLRGDFAFLQKPISPAVLARKVREVLDNGK